MYLQEENALRVDIIRLTIEEWKNQNLIDENEYFYLLASLIELFHMLAILLEFMGHT